MHDEDRFFLAVFAAIAAANSVFTLLRAFSFAFGGLRAAHELHSALLSRVTGAPLSFFDRNPSGRILNRFSSDLYTVDDSLPFIANILLANAFSLTGVLLTLLYSQWQFLLLLLALAWPYATIQRAYRAASRDLRRLDSVSRSPIYEGFAEALDGAATIRAFGAQRRMAEENEGRVETNQRAAFAELAESLWLSLRLQFLAALVVTAVSLTAVVLSTSHDASSTIANSGGGSVTNASTIAHCGSSSTTIYQNGLVLTLVIPRPRASPVTKPATELPGAPPEPQPPLQPSSLVGGEPSIPTLQPSIPTLQPPPGWSCSQQHTAALLLSLLLLLLLPLVPTPAAPRQTGLNESASAASSSAGLAGLSLSYSMPIVSLLNDTLTTFTETEKEMVAVERVQQYLDLDQEADSQHANGPARATPCLQAAGEAAAPAAAAAAATVAPPPPPTAVGAASALSAVVSMEGEASACIGVGLASDNHSSAAWPTRGAIEFRHVSMRYTAVSPLVLRDVSFTVPAGSLVGIAGRTGAGKSSILAVLLRLRPICPTFFGRSINDSGCSRSTSDTGGGSSNNNSSSSSSSREINSSERRPGIYIDGCDVSCVPLSVLRSHISTIPQQPVLIGGSIRENLDPYDEHSDVAIWEALRKCQVADTVTALGGLSARVGDAGGSLSLGQRQLLCFARVLLRKNKIVCLDESTANIDPTTAAAIQRVMETEFLHCTHSNPSPATSSSYSPSPSSSSLSTGREGSSSSTVVVIAHRVRTLTSLPRVIVMEGGRSVEDGDPRTLLNDAGSKFSTLVGSGGL